MEVYFKNGSYIKSIDLKSENKRSKRAYEQQIKFWKNNEELIITDILENERRKNEQTNLCRSTDKNCKCTGKFEDNFNCVTLAELKEVIENQPTAFDVEKVVKQLEDLKMGYYLTIANTGDADKDCAYLNIASAIDRAIEIVKRGGREC